MSDNSLRRIAIIGGRRVPFCRSGTLYAEQTNLDMLTSAFQAVVDRYGLDGKKIDQVIAGAVTTHSRDWNLAREAVLSTGLSPLTPAVTMQQADCVYPALCASPDEVVEGQEPGRAYQGVQGLSSVGTGTAAPAQFRTPHRAVDGSALRAHGA